MTPELARELGDHNSRIDAVHELAAKLEVRFDGFIMWFIGIEATVALALIGIVVALLKK